MFSKLRGTKKRFNEVSNRDNCKARVCHLTTAHKALDTRIFNRQAVSLQKAGYAVTIIGQHPSDEIIDGIKIISLESSVGWTNRIRAGFRILLMSLKQNAAVYHFHDPDLIHIGCLLKVFGKKVIYDVHEDYEQSIISRQGKPLILKLIAWLFTRVESVCSRFFDFIIVADSNIKSKFISMKDKVEIITNVPPLYFMKGIKRKRQDDSFRIVFLGLISKDHGIPEILSAIEQMNYRDKVELHLIGSVREVDLPALWHSNPRVIHHGRVAWERLGEMLAAADVGLFLYQPNPAHLHFSGEGNTKLFEYLGCNLPVLYSDFPKLRRLIDSIGCGVAVDPTDPIKIAKALDGLYEDPALRSTMGEKGRQAVREKYNWGIEERKLLALYQKVLGF